MGRFVRLAPALLLLTCACAHPITITPVVGALPAPDGGRIEKNVGYYIAPENLAKQVETPGGGGDKVKYFPYKESEPALKQVLSNIFGEVYSLPSPYPTETIASKNIAYIFIPTIITDSSSRSPWIWPPSDFTVSLDCRATDATGKVIWETGLKAEAHLPLPEVYRDHSRAGQEAIKEAFLELQNRIVKSEAFR
jgi:hypothetical protein